MKRKRNSSEFSQQIVSSIKTRSQTCLYLPDECWEHVFKFILNNNDGENDHRYLEPLSVVSKQFLSITNRLKFSLTINFDPPNPYLNRLFQRFTNLTSLDLTRFAGDLDALLSTFPTQNFNLKSLKFSNQSKFPANGLRDFSKKIKTLTSLTCSNIIPLSNEDLVLIRDCFPLLEQLELSNRNSNYYSDYSFITSDELNSMSMTLPNLRKVNLSDFFYLKDSSLLNLCKNCEFLEEVVMLKCPFLTYSGIASALRERPTLKSLSIRWRSIDNIISSHFIDSLVSLKSLTCLHLWCSPISDELLCSIAEEGLPLRRLELQNCTNYSYVGISCLLSKCQSIQHLDLYNTEFMNDHHVSELSLFLGDLVSINLSHCRMLTESSLFALTTNCPSLSEIKMKFTCIGEKRVDGSNSTMNLVVSPQLKSLHLAHNKHLRDENIIMFSSMCPNLEFLDLNYCNGISEGIGEVLRYCKIRHLNLAGCSGLKLDRINFKVSTLEVLNLSHSKIDDRSLYAFSKSCFGLLQLDLGRCYDVTDKGVKKVVEKCTKLREINLAHCYKVNDNVIEWMVYTRPTLRKIMTPPYFHCSDKKRKLFLHRGCHVSYYMWIW